MNAVQEIRSAMRRHRWQESNEMYQKMAYEGWQYDAWWWISFVDPSQPEGSQFQGVAIVQGGSLPSVLARSWGLGINPGGEALALQIPAQHVPVSRLRNRLLTREECEEAGL